jgi:hypothetical protein
MSAGLFALTCPQCNRELAIDLRGTGTSARCARCARAYLIRFGHLIPVDPPDAPFEAAGDRATFAPGGVRRGGG